MPGKIRYLNPGTFTRTLGPESSFAKNVKRAGAAKVGDKIDLIGQAAVDDAERRIAELYQFRGDERRRRYKGAAHLAGSMRFDVEGSSEGKYPTFPFTIYLFSDAPTEAVNALNFGANPHKITPSKGKMLVFPKRGLGMSVPYSMSQQRKELQRPIRAAPGERLGKPRRFSKSAGARRQARRSGDMVRTFEVKHPGIQPSYFMEQSLETAVDKVLRQRVKLPRR